MIPQSTIDEVKSRVDLVALVGETVQFTHKGTNYQKGFCPFHNNTKTEALVVYTDTQTWKCFGSCGDGGDAISWLTKRDGLTFDQAIKVLADRVNVSANGNGTGSKSAGRPRPQPPTASPNGSASALAAKKDKTRPDYNNPVAIYYYNDQAGNKYLRKKRLRVLGADGKPVTDPDTGKPEKTFYWEHWDGSKWEPQKGGRPPVAYNLKEIIDAPPDAVIYLPEGEGKADDLVRLGLVATASPNGANGFPPEVVAALAGRQVVILQDNDDKGEHWVNNDAAPALYSHVAQLKIISPTLGGWHNIPKGDVSDWLKGRDPAEAKTSLVNKTHNAPTWSPPPPPPPPEPENPRYRTSWSAADLLATDFPDPEFLIPDILPEGVLGILAGRPKIGKSWLALQWAVATANGGVIFGQQTKKAKVLYLAYEDNPRRLKRRLQAQLGRDNLQNVDLSGLKFEFAWPNLRDGGLAKLETAIAEEGYTFVIVDTIARAARFKQREIEDTTDAIGAIQRLALEFNCTILLIDHHRKPAGNAGDLVDDVTESTGKTAVADTIIGLYRGRRETVATLKTTGRDQEEKELAVKFDPEYCSWQCLGDAGEVAKTVGKQEILEIVDSLALNASFTNIVDLSGKDKGYVSRVLKELVEEGILAAPDGYKKPYSRPGKSTNIGQQNQESQQYQKGQQSQQFTEDPEEGDFVDTFDTGADDIDQVEVPEPGPQRDPEAPKAGFEGDQAGLWPEAAAPAADPPSYYDQ